MALLNHQTGESVIDGSEHRLIFTAGAFVQAEAMLKMSTPEIMARVMNHSVGFTELQALVACGIDGYLSRQPMAPSKATNPTKALKIVEKYGWMPVLTAVAEAVTYSTALGILSDEDRAEGQDGADDAAGSRLDPGTGPV